MIITIFLYIVWNQANMAHPQCNKLYVGAIILFIYYASFTFSTCVCVCLYVLNVYCQQQWILCELLSPNISKAVMLFAEKLNIIIHKTLKLYIYRSLAQAFLLKAKKLIVFFFNVSSIQSGTFFSFFPVSKSPWKSDFVIELCPLHAHS